MDTSKLNAPKEDTKESINFMENFYFYNNNSNAPKDEAAIYFRYLMSVIKAEASTYASFLPKNWCEYNIPIIMNQLELKTPTVESNKTIES
ncbi:uncharacterized protein LOC112592345 isoform X2 [Melanaphis sacchari]|nr:uncharacterized protein LOC112592345 isoform X2 [Melanaphis sacchari]